MQGITVQLYLLHRIYVYNEAAAENRAHRKEFHMTFGF
jgi:hypothetical protein